MEKIKENEDLKMIRKKINALLSIEDLSSRNEKFLELLELRAQEAKLMAALSTSCL